ncbi:hypothetical protein KQI38_05515 [Tissierella carlieri]|nr:hypothetical protein [Tissierella carlieri]MBU5311479.1 hypothetical protein [Tissierella carlieri]
MDDKRVKIKNILILVLVFIIGFGVGMHFAFQTVFNRFERHGIEVNLFP